MNRDEANAALEILASVVQQVRDDLAGHNWGLIQMTHGVVNGIGFALTHIWYRSGVTAFAPYIWLWLCVQAANVVLIAALIRRQGTASGYRRQLQGIWTTFLAAMFLLVAVVYWMGLGVEHLGPIATVNVAIAFSTMGVIIGRWYYAAATATAAAALVMAVFPEIQFIVLGVVICGTNFVGGWFLHRARNARAASPRVV